MCQQCHAMMPRPFGRYTDVMIKLWRFNCISASGLLTIYQYPINHDVELESWNSVTKKIVRPYTERERREQPCEQR